MDYMNHFRPTGGQASREEDDAALALRLAMEWETQDQTAEQDAEIARRLAQIDIPEGFGNPFSPRAPARITMAEELNRRLAREKDRDAELALKLVREEEEDAKLAQRLSEREQSERKEDALLAQRMFQQEQAEHAKVMKALGGREHGIVFSVVIDAASNTLLGGSPAERDDIERFSQWKALFEKSGRKVTRFHWFVNHELEQRFNEARERLIQLKRPSNELQLFHGTPEPNIASIQKVGFKIGGVGGHRVSHGTALGIGIYLATDAATSISYARGTNCLFACRILPGVITADTANISRPPNIAVGAEQYDSYSNGGVYVVRSPCLVLPCYMIEFA